MPPATRIAAPPLKGRPPKVSSQGEKSKAGVNTNLSAHPRTNPVAALNALLKLISSLSTRIGRCQYKLTPAEHVLSIHLLSILDPYVYQGAKTLSTAASAQVKPTFAGLVFQPTEILDSIMAYLDSKRDLMNVALCCKHLHDVIFPRHFEYRVIRCKVSSISVWNHLLVNDGLARNVRRLEIIDERSATTVTPRVPVPAPSASKAQGMVVPRGISQRDTDLDSTDDELRMHEKQEKYLSSALRCMTGLKEFKWSSSHSPISIENIWAALIMRAATLDRLEVFDNLIFSAQTTDADTSSNSSSDEEGEASREVAAPMSSLASAVFRSTRHSYGASKNPDLTRVNSVLARCPKLENLAISFTRARSPQSTPHPIVDEVLEGRWSRLTSVVLTGVRTVSTAPLASFLSEHPLLESVHLDVGGARADALELRAGSLPRLKEIHAAKDIVTALLSSPPTATDEALRPLETVKGPKLSGVHAMAHGKHADDAFMHAIKHYASTLKRVELGGWHDMEDVRRVASALPGLSYLDLGKRIGASTRGAKDATGPVTNLEEWFEVLATLPHLQALHGVKLFYEISSINLTSRTGTNVLASSFSPHSSPAVASNLNAQGTSSAVASFGGERGVDATVAAKIQGQMSLMDRSRMKKNDWTASMLVWRCPKLRRVDHWDEGSSKVIILSRSLGSAEKDAGTELRDGSAGKVRWEVRRARAA